MPLARVAAAVIAVLAAPSARGGVVIEGKDEGEAQRFVMEGQKLRMDTGEQKESMIFDAATKRSVQLYPSSKTYTEFTADDLTKIQVLMKERGGAKKARTTKYEKTGKTEEALGKKCDVYRVVESDAETREEEQSLCLAPFGTFGVSRDDFAPFRAFGEYASQLSGGEVERSWADLPGIPLIAWETEKGETRESFRATKVEKRHVPASEFTVPAGWKKTPGFAEQMEQLERDSDEERPGPAPEQDEGKGAK
jgi:hypothetical protein